MEPSPSPHPPELGSPRPGAAQPSALSPGALDPGVPDPGGWEAGSWRAGVREPSGAPTEELGTVTLPGPRSLAAGIYGLIVSGSVMVAGVGYYTAPKLAIAVLVTVLVYWLAERYADLLGQAVHGRRLTPGLIAHTLREGWPMVQASYAPLATFVILDFFGTGIATAVLVALLISTALLVALGGLAGYRGGLSKLGITLSAAAAGALGLIMVVFKFLLH